MEEIKQIVTAQTSNGHVLYGLDKTGKTWIYDREKRCWSFFAGYPKTSFWGKPERSK